MRVEDTSQKLTQNQPVEISGKGKTSGTLAPLLISPAKLGQYEEWFEWVATVEQALELPLCRLGLLKAESIEGEQHVTPY
jgi:hypothetical protein